jgi:hypothetical protein
MKTSTVLIGTLAAAAFSLAAAPVHAQSFALESAVLDTESGRNLGVTTERGEIAALFRAQKAITFGVLRSAGIPLESLPPDVRARIERFQTTNLEAFRAFSEGLALKDQGRFAQARDAFARAARLDPGFALAAEQQQAMPNVNVASGVQLRAVIATAATAAVDRGKQTIALDASRALAAMQSGLNVVLVASDANTANTDFTSNPAGSGERFSPNVAVALAYQYTAQGNFPVTLADSQEWTAAKVSADGNGLLTVGEAGGFQALRGGAQPVRLGEIRLSEGTSVQWGAWNSAPGASASVTVGRDANNQPVFVAAPTLGSVEWMTAEATRRMPGSGTFTFTPRGGTLADVSGGIRVDFGNRSVQLQQLAFRIGNLNFSNLAGSTNWDAASAAGGFRGSYTGGTCTGCLAFVPTGSNFAGTFAGRDANGLLFSTFLNTGSSFVGGTQVLTRD